MYIQYYVYNYIYTIYIYNTNLYIYIYKYENIYRKKYTWCNIYDVNIY